MNPKKCLVGVDITTGQVIANGDITKKELITFLKIIIDSMENDGGLIYIPKSSELFKA